jgi:photosystem II stability/assembly factor-like uncharacterized protein
MPNSSNKAKKTKTSLRRQWKIEVPRDDPLKRHDKLKIDLMSGLDETTRENLLSANLVAAKGVRGVKGLAELRRAAQEKSSTIHGSIKGKTVAIAPTPGKSNWVQLGPTTIPNGQTYSNARVKVTGRVTAIIVDKTDPNIIYLGAAQGGVWKTIDGGNNWVPKSDNEVSLAIGALAMDPTNHQILYVGTGEGNFSGDSYYGNGVLKSLNGGDTWTLLGDKTFSGARFCRICINPGAPATLFAATSYGVYRSTDGGNNWTKMTSGIPSQYATDIVIDPNSPKTVYAAFWGNGVYKTSNAGDPTPTWTKLASGLPVSGFTRIALDISPSSPQTLYALIADSSYNVNMFYCTNNGGTSWSQISLPGGNIGGQGFYNLNVAVDPTTPDIVYLSGISLWKAVRNTANNTWMIMDIGLAFHPDNHALAFHPTNHLVIYAGSDGGIYKSNDGGATWSDTINEGPCITQFEFIDQHPVFDAVILGGTQDNGTEQFRNSPVFYHADDGDGGFCAIDPNKPNTMLSTYYDLSPKRSDQSGKLGTWTGVWNGLSGNSLFYPPMTLDQSNPNNAAIGGAKLFLDAAQGVGGWPTSVTLPGLNGLISAINYVNSNLIYVGTDGGQVYRLVKSGSIWTPTIISAMPLPSRFIWDVAAKPGDFNTVVLVMSGFGTAHVWKGSVPASGPATWTDISGTGSGRLPDIPANALVIEPSNPNTMYIATDVAVFRTTNGGTTWTQFSEGLPNSAVFDLRLHDATRLLRAAVHGRGIWERKLDVPAMPDVNIFVRDNLVDTGRSIPSPSGVVAPFEDTLHHINLGDMLWWWQCSDVKIDALEGTPPSYQMNASDVDYVAFESKLEHRNPQRGRINRVYVQVHNRGINPATNVTVKVMYADASAGLPSLPADFWKAFPGDSSDTTHWKPIGATKTIPALSSTEPAILEWDWSTPQDAADHSCLLVITDCPDDSIPVANKVFNIDNLVPNEKHVGLKNLHVVDAPPGTAYWTTFKFFGNPEIRHGIEISPLTASGWKMGIIFEKQIKRDDLGLKGIVAQKPTVDILAALRKRIGEETERFDVSKMYSLAKAAQGGKIEQLVLPNEGARVMLLLAPPARRAGEGSVSIIQRANGRIVGGSTFVLRKKVKR